MKTKCNNDQLPFQSIVIPVRNESAHVARTLELLRKQDYPCEKVEIIVVDGQSSDNTVEIVEKIAREDPRIKLLNNPRRLSSAARNIGARAAKGDIITFVDGHTYIDNNLLLANIAYLMKEKNVLVLSRPQFLETPGNSTFQQAVALARESALGHGLDSTIFEPRDTYVNPTSSGASYRREVFDKIGYFDENFDAAEDVDFNFRLHEAGFRAFSSMKLAVYYYPRQNLTTLLRQMIRYGIGRFKIARKHHQYLSSGTGFPVVFLLGLPMFLLLSLLSPIFLKIMEAVYGIYLIINLSSSFFIAAGSGFRFLPYLPLIYFIIHVGLGWGFISEMVRKLYGRVKRVLQLPEGVGNKASQM